MPTATGTSADSRINAACAFAVAQTGKRYVWATAGPNTFDCSGLVYRALQKGGVSFRGRPTTYTLVGMGAAVSGKASLIRGDLVFPNSGHVQLYLGGGKIVEAASSHLPVNKQIRVAPIGGVWRARRLIQGGTGAGDPTASSNANMIGGTGTIGGQVTDILVGPIGAAILHMADWLGEPKNWRMVLMIVFGILVCLLAINRMANVSGKVLQVASNV